MQIALQKKHIHKIPLQSNNQKISHTNPKQQNNKMSPTDKKVTQHRYSKTNSYHKQIGQKKRKNPKHIQKNMR